MCFGEHAGQDIDCPCAVSGPHRVFPGRLSVTRSFGDVECKLFSMGGKPNVVIAEPDISSFNIEDHHDFIILACSFNVKLADGVYDKMSNEDVCQYAWESSLVYRDSNLHGNISNAVDNIIEQSLLRKTLDNVSVAMISFKNFKNCLKPKIYKQPSSGNLLQKHNSKPNFHNFGFFNTK